MIFDDIPLELKERIFTYVTPNEWINTAKVSQGWFELTMVGIQTVQSCHVLILDHLAEFINQQKKTSYSWVSLLALMPNLEHLECCENNELLAMCRQLKRSHGQKMRTTQFDWKRPNFGFRNLTELVWHGCFQSGAFPFQVFELAPKLAKLTLISLDITAEWKKKIPKSVKHIGIDNVRFVHPNQCSINDICEDSSTLETFSLHYCLLTVSAASQFFDKTPSLKSIELRFRTRDATTSIILKNAFRKCKGLRFVKAYDVTITDSWRRVIPENVKSINFRDMKVQENLRHDFAFDWLFQNYDSLQSLQVQQQSWTGFDPQKFYSTKNLKKLVLGNNCLRMEPMDPFSDICARIIRGSHLVEVTLDHPVIDESWRHILPATVEKINLKDCRVSKEAKNVFLPQFICENPSNVQLLSFNNLPSADLNAFKGMNKLQELHLLRSSISGQCLQSILTHCPVLTDLVLFELQDDVFTEIPQNLAHKISLRKLKIEESPDRPSLLLQHFSKIRTVDIAMVPSETTFSDIMNALQNVETVEINVGRPALHLLESFVESIDDSKFRYFCLSYKNFNVSFYMTNSLLHACRKVYEFPFRVKNGVFWINNYPTSPILRKTMSKLPSSMDELSEQYFQICHNEEWDYDCGSDDF